MHSVSFFWITFPCNDDDDNPMDLLWKLYQTNQLCNQGHPQGCHPSGLEDALGGNPLTSGVSSLRDPDPDLTEASTKTNSASCRLLPLASTPAVFGGRMGDGAATLGTVARCRCAVRGQVG